MRKTKIVGIALIIAISLAVIVLSVLYFNSYGIALNKAGIQSKDPVIVDSGINNNGNQYRVVAEYSTGDAHIAYLVKNSVGIWHVERTSETQTSTGFAELSWDNVASIRRYTVSDSSVVEFENHRLYCGNNAIKRIAISEGDIPYNVTVNIHQAGNAYMLHFVAFGSGETLNEIDCDSLLKNAGCVQ